MKIQLHILGIFFSLFAAAASGQVIADGERHSSLDGLYAVTIPKEADLGGGGALEDEFTKGLGDGYSTYWNGPGFYLQAGYVNFNELGTSPSPAKRQKLLLAAITRLKSLGTDYVAFRERKLTVNRIPTIEIVLTGVGKTTVHRLFTTAKSIVRVTATYTSEQSQQVASGFLNSIEAPTRKQLVAEKIKEATPQPLPPCTQTFAVANDLLELQLNGKVRSIIVERVEIEHGKENRSMLEHTELDPSGRLSKRLEYEFGNPRSVSVFGCIDGRRVSKTGYASYENIITALGPEPPGAKPRDERFSNAHMLKMDDKGRISEILTYGNNEVVYGTAKYKYGDRTLEIVKTDVDGNLDKRILQTFDVRNRPTTMVQRWFGSDGTEWRDSYKFVLFDANGNWVKRTGIYERFENGKVEDTLRFTEFRAITYYK